MPQLHAASHLPRAVGAILPTAPEAAREPEPGRRSASSTATADAAAQATSHLQRAGEQVSRQSTGTLMQLEQPMGAAM
eukprot:4930190-Alexandrium_andersonii.AAC.1